MKIISSTQANEDLLTNMPISTHASTTQSQDRGNYAKLDDLILVMASTLWFACHDSAV
jgi:hypothetical protein